MKNSTPFRFFARPANARGIAAVGAVLALAIAIVGVLFVSFAAMNKASAVADATITGKVLSPSGTPISFECFAPGQPPSTCGIGVEANAGPETPPSFGGASTTDGTFSL